MPWDAKSFRQKHNQKLPPAKAGKAAKIANAILARTGDEGLAIATANKRAESALGKEMKRRDARHK